MNEHRPRRRPADPGRTEIYPDRSLWPVGLAAALITAFFIALGVALVAGDDRGRGEPTDLRPSDAGLVCGAGTYRQPIYGRGYDLPDECRPATTTGGDG